MKVLVLNCGSSTLKFKVYEMGKNILPGQGRRVARGIIEKIGGQGTVKFEAEGNLYLQENTTINDHGVAILKVIEWLDSLGLMEQIGAVGHRVIHGGHSFKEPVLINEDVINTLEAFSKLAPLHNVPSLMAIYAAQNKLGPAMPMVAVFDTAFHSNLPERSSFYAIPWELTNRHQIRRYGFHGIAHRYMSEQYAAITSTHFENLRLVTLQLGSGCSAAAVKGGRSIDTSMGFTPLEGLIMGTRSGDIDPSLPGFLAGIRGVEIREVEEWLNKKSGLLGVSGRSQDMRELLELEKRGDIRASLSVDMFCYRVKKQIGAYLSALNGADAVIFGGGIGENSPQVRARICADMGWCGLILDEKLNDGVEGSDCRISADNAGIHAYVIFVDEESIIARDTVNCLDRSIKN